MLILSYNNESFVCLLLCCWSSHVSLSSAMHESVPSPFCDSSNLTVWTVSSSFGEAIIKRTSVYFWPVFAHQDFRSSSIDGCQKLKKLHYPVLLFQFYAFAKRIIPFFWAVVSHCEHTPSHPTWFLIEELGVMIEGCYSTPLRLIVRYSLSSPHKRELEL